MKAAGNILDDIGNMFDDLADQLDAMLEWRPETLPHRDKVPFSSEGKHGEEPAGDQDDPVIPVWTDTETQWRAQRLWVNQHEHIWGFPAQLFLSIGQFLNASTSP